MLYDRQGPYWFSAVSAEQVREPVRQAATRMLAFTNRDLRLPPMRIRWFRLERGVPPCEKLAADPVLTLFNQGAPTRKLRGQFRPTIPDTIWIRATLDPCQVALTVVHEAHHAWQYKRDQPVKEGRDLAAWLSEAERKAHAYMMDRLPVALGILKRLAKARGVPVTKLLA